jgi:hypothetical protein
METKPASIAKFETGYGTRHPNHRLRPTTPVSVAQFYEATFQIAKVDLQKEMTFEYLEVIVVDRICEGARRTLSVAHKQKERPISDFILRDQITAWFNEKQNSCSACSRLFKE